MNLIYQDLANFINILYSETVSIELAAQDFKEIGFAFAAEPVQGHRYSESAEKSIDR